MCTSGFGRIYALLWVQLKLRFAGLTEVRFPGERQKVFRSTRIPIPKLGQFKPRYTLVYQAVLAARTVQLASIQAPRAVPSNGSVERISGRPSSSASRAVPKA